MNKKRIILLCLTLVLFVTGCDKSDEKLNVYTDKEIKEVTINTLPALNDSPKIVSEKADIDKIINYINNLKLKEPTVNADEYVGMTYIITITYEDDSKKEFIHFGNRFFKEMNGAWKEMEYEQAEQFGSIYKKI